MTPAPLSRIWRRFKTNDGMSNAPDTAEWHMTEETIPERPDDPEWRRTMHLRLFQLAAFAVPIGIACFNIKWAAIVGSVLAAVAMAVSVHLHRES